MGNIIQNLRGSVAEHSTYTGKKGVISLVTDTSAGRVPTGEIRIHDESTAGGLPIKLPAGHVIQSKSTSTRNFANFINNTPTLISGFNQQITVKSSNSKILVFLFLAGAGKNTNNTSLLVNITESTTSLDETLTSSIGYSNSTLNITVDTTLFYEHSHNQNAGASLTYTPKLSSRAGNSQVFINNYLTSDGDSYSYILVQELVV